MKVSLRFHDDVVTTAEDLACPQTDDEFGTPRKNISSLVMESLYQFNSIVDLRVLQVQLCMSDSRSNHLLTFKFVIRSNSLRLESTKSGQKLESYLRAFQL